MRARDPVLRASTARHEGASVPELDLCVPAWLTIVEREDGDSVGVTDSSALQLGAVVRVGVWGHLFMTHPPKAVASRIDLLRPGDEKSEGDPP